MEEKHKIRDDLSFMLSLEYLATAYEEVSVMKIRIARDGVLHNRDFLSSLSDVFLNVKKSYKAYMLRKIKQARAAGVSLAGYPSENFETHRSNSKSVMVFLSADKKLYGEILRQVFGLFLKKVRQSSADIVIVGRVGRAYFEAFEPKRAFTYFDIPDSNADIEDLKIIIKHIVQYETVSVFYGKFINVVTQLAVSSNISGEESFLGSGKQTKTEWGFIFEPDIEDVLKFFENQIFSLLFSQAVHEAELARYASRITSMEAALERIHSGINKLNIANRRLKASMANKKQQERIASISLW